MNHQRNPTAHNDHVLNFQITIPNEMVKSLVDQLALAIGQQVKAALAQTQPYVPPVPQQNPSVQRQRLAYSIHETAALLGMSYHSVLRLIKRGLLKSSGALRKKVISEGEIQRFLATTKI